VKKALSANRHLIISTEFSTESAEALAICMPMLDMPPAASAKAHYDASHEAVISMLEGDSELLHGPNLAFKEQKGVVLI
jgi:uncharacterized RmlC-like cupin family protein